MDARHRALAAAALLVVAALGTAGADGNATLTVRKAVLRDRDGLDTPGEIASAIGAGDLPRSETLATRDLLVLAIGHAGLAEALATGNATGRFLDALDGPDASLRIEQTNPGTSVRPRRIRLAANSTTVVADPRNGTAYVVVDLAEAPVEGGFEGDLQAGNRFEARLEIGAASNLTEGNASATAAFGLKVREARVALDAETEGLLYLAPAPNGTVRGTTNLDPGRNVTVVLLGRDDPDTAANESRRLSRVVAVRAPGGDGPARFAAAFDLSSVPAGTALAVDVRFGGRSLLERGHGAREDVTAVVAPVEASVAVDGVNASGAYAAVSADVTLSRGGFVVLHRGGPRGEVVGVSRYLARGEHRNVTVYVGRPPGGSGPLVAAAHRDANFNRWFDGPGVDSPYANASAGTDYVLTRAPTPTATPTPTERPPTGTTPRTAETTGTAATPRPSAGGTTAAETPTTGGVTAGRETARTAGATGTAGTESPGQPGFGPGAALLGLALAALIARRR